MHSLAQSSKHLSSARPISWFQLELSKKRTTGIRLSCCCCFSITRCVFLVMCENVILLRLERKNHFTYFPPPRWTWKGHVYISRFAILFMKEKRMHQSLGIKDLQQAPAWPVSIFKNRGHRERSSTRHMLFWWPSDWTVVQAHVGSCMFLDLHEMQMAMDWLTDVCVWGHHTQHHQLASRALILPQTPFCNCTQVKRQYDLQHYEIGTKCGDGGQTLVH